MRYAERRAKLLALLERPLLLMAGGHAPRNYVANPYPYRADSNFLYFFSSPEPDSAALFDPGDGSVTLFVPDRSLDDEVWHGRLPSLDEVKTAQKVSEVKPLAELEFVVAQKLKGRPLDGVAVADSYATSKAARIAQQDLDFHQSTQVATPQLAQLLAKLRLIKHDDEVQAMRHTAQVTRTAHVSAMTASRPGVTEQRLAGIVEGAFAVEGCVPAYQTILSVRGEVLHNHSHHHRLTEGDIVLLDAGAESANGYCSDVTRCWPVGGPFSAEGKEVYDIVLDANLAAIGEVKPGVRYRDVHLAACRVIADGLRSMGLLKGNPDALVEAGAHALFFPHGVGHQIGLDVHDLEPLGDQVLYPNGRTRSTQFGTKYLRMDMDLEPGMTFTIEPGVYFVPAILRSPDFHSRFKGQVDFEAAERFLTMNEGRGFGGIRIEDDVLCTPSGADVLTAAIPKSRADIESLVSGA